MWREERVVKFDPKTFKPGSIVTYCLMELEDKYPPVNRKQIEGKHKNGLIESYNHHEIKLILSDGNHRLIKISQVVNGPDYKKGEFPIKIIAVADTLKEEN